MFKKLVFVYGILKHCEKDISIKKQGLPVFKMRCEEPWENVIFMLFDWKLIEHYKKWLRVINKIEINMEMQ